MGQPKLSNDRRQLLDAMAQLVIDADPAPGTAPPTAEEVGDHLRFAVVLLGRLVDGLLTSDAQLAADAQLADLRTMARGGRPAEQDRGTVG